MNGYLWAILIVFIVLYFYINRNRKQKQGYFQAVMAALQEKGVPSKELLEKLTPTESGKILVNCFNRKIPPQQAADMLLEKYNSL
ncbi:MAG: hypothetical protein GX776_05470 [Oxalobacter sp.]|nr:hypothetical protein [Oxalobacter sp.]